MTLKIIAPEVLAYTKQDPPVTTQGELQNSGYNEYPAVREKRQ